MLSGEEYRQEYFQDVMNTIYYIPGSRVVFIADYNHNTHRFDCTEGCYARAIASPIAYDRRCEPPTCRHNHNMNREFEHIRDCLQHMTNRVASEYDTTTYICDSTIYNHPVTGPISKQGVISMFYGGRTEPHVSRLNREEVVGNCYH